MKIKMTSIPVNDPIKAFRFYTDVLGFKEHMYDPKGKLAIVINPAEPESTSLLLEPIDMQSYKTFQETMYSKGIPANCFSVPDLKAEYIRLINLDVKFKKEPTEMAWGWEAIFDDTQGNFIQLIQD